MSEKKTNENIPYIKRTIDGATYTVIIHFTTETKDTAKDKMKRVLKDEMKKLLNAE